MEVVEAGLVNSQDKPFFSVVLCTYNRAHILGRALRSLINQDFACWEAEVIDDGSGDDTEKLVGAFAAECRKIRYHKRPHCGLPSARNFGALVSRGSYITFLDSDDEYLPHHLSSRYAILKAEEIEFLHGGVSIVGDSWAPDREDPRKLVHLSECAIGGTFFMTPRAFKRVGGFKTMAYAEDSAFYAEVRQQGLSSRSVTIPSYRYYRGHSDSITASMCRLPDA